MAEIARVRVRLTRSEQNENQFRIEFEPQDRPTEMLEMGTTWMTLEGALAAAFEPGQDYNVIFEEA